MAARSKFIGSVPQRTLALVGLVLCACDPGDFGPGSRDAGTEPPVTPDRATDSDDASDAQVPASDGGPPSSPTVDGSSTVDAVVPSDSDAGVAPIDASPKPSVGDGASAQDAALAEASTRDAEVPDAAAKDAGPAPPVGQSACYSALASRAVCEGFETAPESPRFRLHATDGLLGHVSTPTRVGVGALKASSTGAGGNAFVQREAFSKLKSGSIYVRSYLYIPSAISLDTLVVHGLAEDPLPWGGVSVVLRDTGGEVDVHAAGPGTLPTFVKGAAMAIPRNRWFCLQFSISISDTAGTVQLSIDGKSVAAGSGLDTLPTDGYSLVTAGVIYTGPMQSPVELYIDELVADTRPIACD